MEHLRWGISQMKHKCLPNMPFHSTGLGFCVLIIMTCFINKIIYKWSYLPGLLYGFSGVTGTLCLESCVVSNHCDMPSSS